jgi:predicted XRE-type DNA-binding protein
MRTAPLYRLKMQIRKIILDYIEKEKLTQKQAAYRLGVTQPAINDLKNQGVKNFSLDRMVTMLHRTGHKIQIKIEKK